MNNFYDVNFRYPGEIFNSIMNYSGYLISNYGRVLSISRNWHVERGKSKENKILRLRERRHGYYCVALYNIDGKRRSESIHRLVASAFVDNPNNYNEVNHKDGNKQNNIWTNIEWCSRSYNTFHSIHVLGQRIIRGEDKYNSKLKEKDIRLIRKVYKIGKVGVRPLASLFGVSRTTMRDIIKNKIWKSVA